MTLTTSSAPLWRSLAFTKQTRRGKLLRVCREHYLRDDISCFSDLCELCPRPDAAADGSDAIYLSKRPFRGRYLVPDTNVFLHQMDLLESSTCPAFTNVVVTQTVLEEVKHRNLSLYRRLRALLKMESKRFIMFSNEHHRETYVDRKKSESVNDRNDRAIRATAAWFQAHLAPTGAAVSVLLLTNDRANRSLAEGEEIDAMTIEDFTKSLSKEYPEVMDLLAQVETASSSSSFTQQTANGGAGGGGKKRPGAEGKKSAASNTLYTAHLPLSELTLGIKAGKYFQGTLRCGRDNWLNCTVLVQGKGQERVAVRIQGHENINRAMDGDVVAIKILPQEQWQKASNQILSRSAAYNDKEGEGDDAREEPAGAEIADIVNVDAETEAALPPTAKDAGAETPCGKVVGVIKRNWRTYCGSIDIPDGPVLGNTVLFVPVDKKVPKIRITTRQREALLDKRILVTIDDWPVNSRFPNGHYVKTLGTIGDKETETQVLLLEHNIPTEEFAPKIIACLPPSNWLVTEQNSTGRRDLRGLPVMSIDPPGCKDIDDALHYRKLPNGNHEVGVHIADVTHFVAAGSPLDEEAANRGTSTYLVERRLDMLPALLTTDICSLRGGVDRFAFSVIWEFTDDYEVVDVQFFKSVIHSIAAMTYNEAQLLLDDPNANDVKGVAVKNLNKIARMFRQRRLDAGALTLASPEVRFTLDTETQNPLDVQMYQLKETNALVEEFMLFANITVAKKILRHYPTFSMLRRHPAPSRRQFDELISEAEAVGVKLNVDTSKTLAESLDQAELPGNAYFNKLVRIMTTRCMRPAEYFCSGEYTAEEYYHYGLAAPIYTHFTSPIRRYADVVVHRLLASAIGVAPLPRHLESKALLHDVAENLNRRHLAAQQAGRASVQLHTLLYFKEHPTVESAVIMRVKANAVVVLIPRFGIEGTIYLLENRDASSTDTQLVHDEEKHTIYHRSNPKIVLRVFDPVTVKISVATKEGVRSELVISLQSPSFPTLASDKIDVASTIKDQKKENKRGGQEDVMDEVKGPSVERLCKKAKT